MIFVQRRFGLFLIFRVRHSHVSAKKQPNLYNDTVLLPKSSFASHIKALDRAKLDQRILALWHDSCLYDWQYGQEGRPLFVLHDGPPYANGQPHVGHAVNKILKDITLRYRVQKGYRVHYKPGWDCHGLPIELKAVRDADAFSALRTREIARTFAEQTVAIQKRAFLRWGCLADWANGYFTMESSYVVKQLELIWGLHEKGLLYRDFKPVYWSPSSRTALAEAELEYNALHESPSIFVKFPLQGLPCFSLPVYALIWTTTPWTLPMNDAICYNANAKYILVEPSGQKGQLWLIAAEVRTTLEALFKQELQIRAELNTSLLGTIKYTHPLYPIRDKQSLIDAAHVSMEKGTGLVHTSFAHGFDDYNVAQRLSCKVRCDVDEQGRYATNFAVLELAGQSVLDSGNEIVLRLLESFIVFKQTYTHSYPYDWRTKRPVIIRASKQWFIDTCNLRAAALECVDKCIQFFPATARSSMRSQVERKPAWCISRQRVWGVPLPVFYDEHTDEPIFCRPLVRHIISLVQKHGTDAWWSMSDDELFPLSIREQCGVKHDVKIKKGADIVDIWLDSGSSWTTLPGEGVADVVIEGLDQFRGWFLSLLLTSVANRGAAPYKTIVTHGFVQDEQGRKMSKSLGNVVDPFDITDGSQNMQAAGADVLRFWVANYGSEHTIVRLGPQIIDIVKSNLAQIRTVFRFLLGVLSDFNPHKDVCSFEQLSYTERYMLTLLTSFISESAAAYERYDYNAVAAQAMAFLHGRVSSFYIVSVKDRLYCDRYDSLRRRGVQTVLWHVLISYLKIMAPILPFFAQEVVECLPSIVEKNVFKLGWPVVPREWRCDYTERLFSAFEPIRQTFLTQFGKEKTAEFHVLLNVGSSIADILKVIHPEDTSSDSELCDLLRVGIVTVHLDKTLAEHDYRLKTIPNECGLCLRCRRQNRRNILPSDDLCLRCEDVVSSLQKMRN